MFLLHNINLSDVRPGDHLYRWRLLRMQQGIAIRFNDNPQIFVVMSCEPAALRLITLSEFKGWGILRRALYDQGDSYAHLIKLNGTSFVQKSRPAKEIVQNALLLLETMERHPDRVRALLVDDFAHFARACCTMSHEYWRNMLLRNENGSPPSDNFQRTCRLPSTSSIDEQKVKELEDKIQELEDEQACSICMERPRNVAFLCGHMACFECTQTLTRCHMCRKNIHQKINLFSC